MAKILFDSYRAREAQRKSVEAYHAKKAAEAQQEREAIAAMLLSAAKPPAEDYASRRLARVRAQLDKLDELFATAAAKPVLDGRLLNDLAAAQARLATQEQQLAGRPLPGSRRPGKERAPRSAVVDPLEPLD